ncbi:MAG: hypothetical protein COB51_02785 [Moraxellaceae bacterium]|nr:MAG: hypothetical protein COB51_02785 [Moraxellaceae bacterium]
MINIHMSRSNAIRPSLSTKAQQNIKLLPSLLTLIVTLPLILFLVWTQSSHFSEARFILSNASTADAIVINKDIKKRINAWGQSEQVYRIYLAFNTVGISTYASYYDTSKKRYQDTPYGAVEKVSYSNLSADINGRHSDLVAAASLFSIIQKIALPVIIIILGMILLLYYPSKYLMQKYLLPKP